MHWKSTRDVSTLTGPTDGLSDQRPSRSPSWGLESEDGRHRAGAPEASLLRLRTAVPSPRPHGRPSARVCVLASCADKNTGPGN